MVDVPYTELAIEVLRPQELQVRHHELPQFEDIVPKV